MGRSEIKVPSRPYVYGGDLEGLCRECQLPCRFEEMSVDCCRRFFQQGLLECTYFVHGYCFLEDTPGCVFDNGGQHDVYWQTVLNRYFHNIADVPDEPEFDNRAEELKGLLENRIRSGNVPLCRYIEEYYNRVMETGGGMSEEMMNALDAAYEAFLAGAGRKK